MTGHIYLPCWDFNKLEPCMAPQKSIKAQLGQNQVFSSWWVIIMNAASLGCLTLLAK